MFALAMLVGVISGAGAAVLELGLHYGGDALVGRFTHLGTADVLRFHWGVLLLPALGGALSGLIVAKLAPEARGHGTDALIRAFHHNMGDLPLKGPAVRAATVVAVLSCGGSTGPEGPTAGFTAAIGSAVSKLFATTARERRILLLSGCAAGVGSIFQCPLGGALFAAGIPYREPEYETDAVVPSIIASVMGYSTFISLLALMHLPTHSYLLTGAESLGYESARWLPTYALLGPLCGVIAILLSSCMRVMEQGVMPRLRLPLWLAPALGGLATGALACIMPQVMDGRYRFIQNAMDGTLFGGVPEPLSRQLEFIALIIVFKCVATSFTVGSGASGGVLGPSVFLGGTAGILVGVLCEWALPGQLPDDVRRALIPVGMGAVLAATMRAPLAAVVMATEMTGSYKLMVPLMLACVGSYLVGRRWGTNHEQLPTAADSPAHAADAVVNLLESWRVGALMDRDWRAVAAPDTGLDEIIRRIEPGTRPVFAVIDGAHLSGVISLPDLQRIGNEPGLSHVLIAADLMTERLIVVHADDDVYHALAVFQRENHDVLPVVSRDGQRRFLGMLTRRRVFDALREYAASVQKSVFQEHAGLAAIEREGQIEQLLLAVAPERKDRVQRLLVPMDAVGRSLREADFRRVYGAEVIAIELADGSLQCPPDINAALTTSQRLLAIVSSGDTGSR